MDTNVKQKIWEAIVADRLKWNSDSAHANSLKIHATAYNRLKKGHYDDVKVDKWINMAHVVGYVLDEVNGWVIVPTATYITITAQLEACRKSSITGMFCDKAGIGKTEAAKDFAKKHKNVAYVDCSKAKSKQRFINTIMRAFGCEMQGTYYDRLDRLENLVKTLDKPTMIFDEAGDLDYPAYLEIKSLYNRLEGYCAFYQIGADGLREKIERNRGHFKVGYDEIYDRFGGKYQKIVPEQPKNKHTFMITQARQVLKANAPDMTADQIEEVIAQDPGLRRIKIYVKKRREGKKAA